MNRTVHRGGVATDDDDDDNDDDSSAAAAAAAVDAILVVVSNKWSLSMTRLSAPQLLHTNTVYLTLHSNVIVAYR